VIAALAALLVLGLAIAGRALYREPAHEGQWFFPRGGPYILGFQADGPAKLFVDGRVVAEGQGVVTKRHVFAAGVYAMRFEGQGRLLWHPPGRRGAPEYVPASSISADGRFAAPGTSRGDAFFASAIVLVVLVAGVLLWRPRPTRDELVAFGALFAVALGVRWLGLGEAGQTWDEDEYWSSGRNYLVNLVAGDFRDASWRWNFEHPPITKYVAGLGALWQDGYGVARALFGVLGAATCVLGAAIGRRLFGWRAGLFAGLVLAFTPHLVGHSQIVGHETTSVFCWTLAVLLALRVHDGERLRVGGLVWLGVALGLAAATRFANLLVVPVCAVILLVQAGQGWKRTIGLGLAVVPVTAVAVFVAVWPRMWTHPFLHLDEAWQKLRVPHALEPYLGVHTTNPAWHYFLLYTLVVTPVVVTLLALGAGAWRAQAKREWRSWIIVLAWLAAPYVIGRSPVRQDGVRYVLAVLVPLAVVAGAGLDQLVSRFRDQRVPLLAGGLVALYLAVTCLVIRPYYIDYYAEPIGTARAQRGKLFEVAWWGEGIAEAVAYVNRHAAPDARLYKAIDATHVGWFRDDLFRREVQSPGQAEWIVVNDAGAFARKLGVGWRPSGFELVHDVRAGGASLVRVYRRVLP
jgi:4-amino-4-deoxy-L-arabinose transferase-like glycosyltransferase